VGDVKYKNPPSWSGKSTQGANNSTKDLLGLMAKGNIVLGDYTSSGWLTGSNGIETNMKSQTYVPAYDCDTSDAAIGYPSRFNATSGNVQVNYTSVEKVPASEFAECVNAGLADFVPGGRDASTSQFGKNRGQTATVKVGSHKEIQRQKVESGGHYETQTIGRGWNKQTVQVWVPEYTYQNVEVDVDDYETRPVTSFNRKYYESVCNDNLIKNNAATITQIDAVLYNNHTICGHVGKCSFNGALVCRNEAIRYSSGLYLNWDIRLYSGSSETVDNDKVGLAKSSDNPPRVIDWRELPEGVVSFD
jgi:hypothetical protein